MNKVVIIISICYLKSHLIKKYVLSFSPNFYSCEKKKLEFKYLI